MRHRPWITDMGWGLAKTAVLIAVFVTLAGFTMFSHMFSTSRAGRIACVANIRAMREAYTYYEADSGGNTPQDLEAIRPFYSGPPTEFGTCPADPSTAYAFDPESGTFHCPTAEHGTKP